ncbi:2'-5' RNA ligase [Cribrihabitans marinus]|uniref:RNA 2',3'-cyclic phosphodiesterase n=1 Tax=Cribrihabitans marinus TaxID=1227549 RepID=A0A1H6Y4X8_9RHOB|nr:RNA 2',3'-cyclic phosphodiesterase [Cribrihabitans marinus]GGH28478.1 RNA 2',3'-cyclic phosphodiesterase [Cribrihabitans marinus]SEJ35506.1 2'-5' RNA ligase [Cribrihabitans marinus]
MRSFLALPLSEDARARLGALQASIPVGRAVPVDNLHVTLAFLDDRSEADLSALNDELELADLPACALRLEGLVALGGAAPRVIGAAVVRDAALDALHSEVQRAVRRAGLKLPRRRFRPHVTLARLQPWDAGDVPQILAAESGFRLDAGPVAELVLYRSVLRRDGARHDALAAYPLAGADGA